MIDIESASYGDIIFNKYDCVEDEELTEEEKKLLSEETEDME